MSFLSFGGKHAKASVRQKMAQKRSVVCDTTETEIVSLPKRQCATPVPLVDVITDTLPLVRSSKLAPVTKTKEALLQKGPTPWCDNTAFEPLVLDDVLLYPTKTKEDLFRWMQSQLLRPCKDSKAIVFLKGPAGSCKRTLVRVAARTCGVPCEEPPCLRLRDVTHALSKNVCTRAFCLDRTRAVERRVWLFSGLDGLLSAADGDTAASDVMDFYDLVSALHAMGASCPPIVFTATSSEHLRMRELRSSPFVFKLYSNTLDYKKSQVFQKLSVVARRACIVANVSTTFADMALSCFDGDMKRLMTLLELSSRGLLGDSMSLTTSLVSKDEVLVLNLNDAFQACKFILQPTSVLSEDALSTLFDKFSLLGGLLRENACLSLRNIGDHVHDLADIAEVWSNIDVCDATYWQHPALSDSMHLVAVKKLRDYRTRCGCSDIPFMLPLPMEAAPNVELLQNACFALCKPVVRSPCATGLARIEEAELFHLKKNI